MVRNTFSAPVQLLITVTEDEITGSLCCATPLVGRTLEFRRVRSVGKEKEVLTLDGEGEILCRSVYG